MYQMPTGTGKTRLFTSVIRDISLKSLRENRRIGILIVAHRTELIEQIDESLKKYRIPHGIIAGTLKERRDISLPIQVASVQTITHPSNYQLAKDLNIEFIIIDEAHHAVARSYQKLWKYFPESKKLGVTATPWRMDGRGFLDAFDVLIPSMSVREFMKKGWLASYKYYSISAGNELTQAIDSIHDFGIDGDYKTSALEKIVDTKHIRAQLLESYLQFVKGKKGIIYSISKAHSKHICQQFTDEGITAVDIDSDTPSQIRKKYVSDFKAGLIDIIVNVDIFSEGFDCPDLEFVQLARPTRSLVKYIQQVGRGLRKNGDKECIILDNVGMCYRFGLPDEEQPWENYFEGNKSESASDKNTRERSETYIERPRIIDISEGSEEMSLIQSADYCKEEYPSSNILAPEDEVVGKQEYEIRSRRLFSKYEIVETQDGFFIYNSKTGKRQLLCETLGRRSISIKIAKGGILDRGQTVYSSSNRAAGPTENDRIIGYLYKDGNILKFIGFKAEKPVSIIV